MSGMKPSRRQTFATAFASICSLIAIRQSVAQSNAAHQTANNSKTANNQALVPNPDSIQVTQYEYWPDEEHSAGHHVSYTVYDAQGRVIRSGDQKPLR